MPIRVLSCPLLSMIYLSFLHVVNLSGPMSATSRVSQSGCLSLYLWWCWFCPILFCPFEFFRYLSISCQCTWAYFFFFHLKYKFILWPASYTDILHSYLRSSVLSLPLSAFCLFFFFSLSSIHLLIFPSHLTWVTKLPASLTSLPALLPAPSCPVILSFYYLSVTFV